MAKKKTMTVNMDETINLNHLKELQSAFTAADVDAGGSLDQDEFIEAFGSILGSHMTRQQLAQLFMKIDANSDGSVDWEEFSNFMLLENENQLAMMGEEAMTDFLPSQTIADPNPRAQHKDMIDKIRFFPPDKYITTSRDGALRFWNAKTMHHLKTIQVEKCWVTDCSVMRHVSRIAVSSMKRYIALYDITTLEQTLRIDHTKGVDAVPLCVDTWLENGRQFLGYGDDSGNVTVFEIFPNNEEKKVFRTKAENKHTDWIQKIQYIPELNGLVTCSLDTTLKIFDLEKRTVKKEIPDKSMKPEKRDREKGDSKGASGQSGGPLVSGHSKGIYSFAWSQKFRMLASCGLDRHIVLWNPYTGRPNAILTGHTASVQEVLVNEKMGQLVSLSVDKVVKLWDLRSQRCLRTIIDKNQYRPENRLSAMVYNEQHSYLITATTRIQAWPMRQSLIEGEALHRSHDYPVVSALYNRTFQQVVSGDEGSVIRVWSLDTGEEMFRFNNIHGEEKITTMMFDHGERRLLTGGHDCEVKLWNFSNGGCLKRLLHPEDQEITTLAYHEVSVEKDVEKFVFAAGWSRNVYMWEDDPEESLATEPVRTLRGHQEDIIAIAFSPPNTIASADYDGRIIVWNKDSGYRRFTVRAPGADKKGITERAVEKLVFLPKRGNVLVAANCDGTLQFWHPLKPLLLLHFDPGHCKGASISCMYVDPTNSFLFTGDSAGFLKVWDVSQIPDSRDTPLELCHMSQLYYWRAHPAACTNVDLVYRGEERYVITASNDGNVGLWTIQGRLIGFFGGEPWSLLDERTWLADEPEPVSEEPDLRHRFSRIVAKIDEADDSEEEAIDDGPGDVAGQVKRLLNRGAMKNTAAMNGVPMRRLPLYDLKDVSRSYVPKTSRHGHTEKRGDDLDLYGMSKRGAATARM